jgi:hypothetical protein
MTHAMRPLAALTLVTAQALRDLHERFQAT